ncbi:MAG: hypothetical protein KDB80_12810 [Planctomycetes bacterium]|nr:hypothetical protein [Planctomycetota bacterium]
MMPLPTVVTLDQLSETIHRLILGNPMSKGRKLLGIEYERLLLDRSTRESAPLEFCRDLLARLCKALDADPMVDGDVLKGLRAGEFEMSMEPGGQLEVACAPVSKLAEAESIMQRVDAVIESQLDGTPYELACLGHAPVTPVEDLGLLPRERYQIMDRLMPARGPLTRNMMRATAGFQLTYDIESDADAASKLALLYRLSPVFVALAANSREVAGKDSGYASYRHLVWWETDFMRSGVPEGCLDPATAIDGYIRYAREATVLFRNDPERAGGLLADGQHTLEEVCTAGELTEADVDLHLTSLFPFVRLRNYIEVRCLDSVEWSLARSMLALISGIVYCPAASAKAMKLSDELLPASAEELRDLHLATAKDALDATAPSGRTLRELARELVGFANATLGGATCDWAEPSDLDEVRARLG